MPADKLEKYGQILGDWKIKKTIYENERNGTKVFQVYKMCTDWEEYSALKVVPIIDDYGDWSRMPEEIKNNYLEAKLECCRKAEKEVKLMHSLRGCSHIVPYYDFKFCDWSLDNHFGCDLLIRMELLECLRFTMRTKLYSENDIVKIGIDICKALVSCQKKDIIHRDIKPDNIFINETGDYFLGDFGIARILNNVKKASTYVGTIEYMAPEQIRGIYSDDDYKITVDIYGLGLTLYELSNDGKLPFAKTIRITSEENIRRLNGEKIIPPKNVGKKLSDIILKACEYEEKKRYQSANEMLRELLGLSGDKNIKDVEINLTSDNDIKPEVDLVPDVDKYATALAQNAVCTPATKHKININISYTYYIKGIRCYNDETEDMYARHREAIKWFKKSAELNNSDAQNKLGDCYYYGKGIRRNYSEAVKWYIKASEKNNANVFLKLGNCYYKGEGIDKNYGEAVKWYLKAAAKDNAVAQVKLANCYYNGEGMDKNYEKAVEWYRRATRLNFVTAQICLGNCYRNGEGVKKDCMEAVRLYQMAIDNNEHEYTAVYNLGDCYFNGEGVVKDYEEGLRLYIKAAEMGYPIAMYRLGDCYYNGEGVVKDYGEAFKWYYKSAERNYPRGQYRTGWCYYYGVGVSVDYNKAYEYFRKAAEKNDPDALYMQGFCCFNEKDYKFAVYCYELAVKAGLKEDIYNYYKTAKIKSYFIR